MDDTIFMPHSMCLAGNRLLIKLMNGGDTIIALSYIFASLAILYLCWAKWNTFRGVSRWFIFTYGLFIISCAITHIMDVVVFYRPHYWIQMWVVMWTALIAVPSTIFTIKIVPWFLGLASAPEALASSLNKLQLQVAQLNKLQRKAGVSASELRAAKQSILKQSETVRDVIGQTLRQI
jgi:two-component system NtrC family sensor kinase